MSAVCSFDGYKSWCLIEPCFSYSLFILSQKTELSEAVVLFQKFSHGILETPVNLAFHARLQRRDCDRLVCSFINMLLILIFTSPFHETQMVRFFR